MTKLLPQLGYDTMQAMCEFESGKKRRDVKGSVVCLFNSPAKKLKKGPGVSLQTENEKKSSSLLNLVSRLLFSLRLSCLCRKGICCQTL